MCLEQIFYVLNGLFTPTIASVAVYIAWQQWQTNRQKLTIDLYDRRLRVYKEIKRFLSKIAVDAAISAQELLEFYSSVSESHFLFGVEIPEYIEEIYSHGTRFLQHSTEYRDHTRPHPDGYDHAKVVREMNQELQWLVYEGGKVNDHFKKYLGLSS